MEKFKSWHDDDAIWELSSPFMFHEDLDVEFLQVDMRAFERSGSFDVALSLYATFGYFKDPAEIQAVLTNIYKSLKPTGWLILELMGKEVLARIYQAWDWQETGRTFLLQDRRIRKNWSWMENHWILIRDQERIEYNISHWVHSAFELAKMLTKSGFDTIDIFGGLDGLSYDHTARRLVIVAGK